MKHVLSSAKYWFELKNKDLSFAFLNISFSGQEQKVVFAAWMQSWKVITMMESNVDHSNQYSKVLSDRFELSKPVL